MKQIDIIRTYAQKRCLIVDSVPNARAHLKRILVDFGVNESDTVGNAEEAIDACQKRQYDIVISDYNLGQGRNGQQLLEELRFNHLLCNTSLFIMLTAENASHYVLHALEYEPDDFLQKPINRDSLRPRLDVALLKNEYLYKIKAAVDDRKHGRAIAEAEALVHSPHRFQNDVRKLLGELYLAKDQPDDAIAIYHDDAQDRPPIWAAMGIARAHYLKQEFEAAEKQLNRIIGENPYFIEASDLLAKIYERTHREIQSQQMLINAVKLSPRSAPRQRELGRISFEIEDENTSVHAYRSAIRHAKNSCHESPDDQLNLAKGLVKLAEKSTEQEAKELLKEAKTSLSQAEKQHGKHPIVMMRNHLVSAEIADNEGKQRDADASIQAALDLHQSMRYSVIGNTSIQLCIDCAKGFMDRGCNDEGEAILQELARINKDPEYATKIDRLLRVPKTQEGIAYAAKLNKEGIGFYEQGKIAEAINSFKKVQHELPNHIGLNLNLIQALIAKSKTSELPSEELGLLQSSFLRLGQVRGSESFYKRYEYLHKRYQRLIQSK